MDDVENDASGRPSRGRRPRPVSSSITNAGREREFVPSSNGITTNGDMSAAVTGAAAAAANANEETEALLRKLRNL